MPRKPHNIIVCLCDQLRASAVGCYGDEAARTPHMDRMAAEGVRFETACSNAPVCTPARSVLLTGQYARTCTGALKNVADTPPAEERVRLTDTTLPEALNAAGYHSTLIGKWHIHPHPSRVGFDKALFPYHRHRHTGQRYYNEEGATIEAPGYAPDWEAGQVRAFLEEPGEYPFFLFYNISPPHMPLADAPAKYTGMFDPAGVPLRANVFDNGEPAHDERWFKVYRWDHLYSVEKQPHTRELPDGFDLRALTALYYGLTTWVDDLLGRLLDTLAATGRDRDTLVVFASDHGDMLGSHGAFNKSLLYDEAIRVPLLLRWPGELAPRVCARQVASLVDLMPTVLGLAGVPIPPSVQGNDLSRVARGDAPEDSRSCAFIETARNAIGIRTATHLLGTGLDTDEGLPESRAVTPARMFHDLRADPYELTNLAGSDAQADTAETLMGRLRHWHETTPWLDV
jgi:choline-sulfatase